MGQNSREDFAWEDAVVEGVQPALEEEGDHDDIIDLVVWRWF
jgi:hypothetical protein